MIEGLVAGKLYSQPELRAGKKNDFVLAKVRALASNGKMEFVNVIAFDEDVQDALLALDVGDAVSLTGKLTSSVWTDGNTGEVKSSIGMTATQVLTAYHVTRKRDAVAAAGEKPKQQPRQEPPPRQRAPGMVTIPEDEKWEGVFLDGERWEAALREMPDWSDVPVPEECH